jgi:hypothetical protein
MNTKNEGTRTIFASLGTVVGVDRLRVREAMMFRFRRVRSPSCMGLHSEESGCNPSAMLAFATTVPGTAFAASTTG